MGKVAVKLTSSDSENIWQNKSPKIPFSKYHLTKMKFLLSDAKDFDTRTVFTDLKPRDSFFVNNQLRFRSSWNWLIQLAYVMTINPKYDAKKLIFEPNGRIFLFNIGGSSLHFFYPKILCLASNKFSKTKLLNVKWYPEDLVVVLYGSSLCLKLISIVLFAA